ncbi:50S ribosomal subunit protein L17 [Candidatus Hodgkinia cicadicola]|uniref:50S ribosomal subunit protein L17 n=1 Tax=Candidatus Hodgkinia cicadicola TaxID=573658 RepID=A0ABX4MH72_9HYPH|nr:50S ribosomal subunit protein L17 [Candidatus Hodgkinia cicadicola]
MSQHNIVNLTRDFIRNQRTTSSLGRLRRIQLNVERIIRIVRGITAGNLQENIKLLRLKLKCSRNFVFLTIYLLKGLRSINGGWTKIERLWRRDGDNTFMSVLTLSR